MSQTTYRPISTNVAHIFKSIFRKITSFLTLFFIVVLVGDAGVGKTHLVHRYVKNKLPENNVPTIGVEFATKTVDL